jgi:hypothetical protein
MTKLDWIRIESQLIRPRILSGTQESEAVFSSFKIPKNLQDSPSHQIFGRMHEALNVGKK